MKILLNGVDYSTALMATPALTIVRNLNKPSQCSMALDLNQAALAMPARNSSVAIEAADGTVLFTGYLCSDPLQELMGTGTEGPVYRTHVAAVSQDFALDRQPLPWMQGGVAQGAADMLRTMTGRLSAQGIATSALAGGPAVGSFRPAAGTSWSANAGALAAISRSAYRVHQNALALTTVGTVVHPLNGSQTVTSFSLEANRPLANDVTLSGAEEPGCYVLDLFEGDGATTEFDLSRAAFAVKQKSLVDDGFVATAINTQVWTVQDPGSHLSLGDGGLVLSGGNGSDGQTLLSAIDPVELGGSLVLEAGSVMLSAGSAGQICGLYSGSVTLANCLGGFRVRSSGGALLLVPVVNGEEAGTVYTMTPNHAYCVRLRIHFPEVVRSLATYYSAVEGAVTARGGGLTDSACRLEFELQDSAAAPNIPAVVLYDGSLAQTPATALFCAVNSVDLTGTVGYCKVTQPSTAWVSSVETGTAERTRRIGLAAEGAECHVSAGKLRFYIAATPAAGELIKLRYRTSQRAIARLNNAASQASESANQPADGVPAVAQWAGRVEKPVARCAADCEAAAQAVLDFATSRDAAWRARATVANLHQQATGDCWPGDFVALAGTLAAGSSPAEMMVRGVVIRDQAAVPELLEFSLELANEWADCLSVKLHDTPATDAELPQRPAVGANHVAENLPLVDVTSVTSSAITIAVNATAPEGGGFEVRREDAGFGDGTQPGISAQGLVLRSPVATLTLPRAAEREQFFIRMYDGSTPPLYSRVSAAIFTDVPLA